MFVGQYEVALSAEGELKLPEEWLPFFKDGAYLLPDPKEKSLRLIPSETFEKQLVLYRRAAPLTPEDAVNLKQMDENDTRLIPAPDGLLTLGEKPSAVLGHPATVILTGAIRLVLISMP